MNLSQKSRTLFFVKHPRKMSLLTATNLIRDFCDIADLFFIRQTSRPFVNQRFGTAFGKNSKPHHKMTHFHLA